MSKQRRLWLGRVLIGAVLFMNVQAAIAFFLNPGVYAPYYELSGVVGEAAIQGFAVLFLMWNVPYVVALIHPVKYRISLVEAVAMQAIGLVGETMILLNLPDGYETLHSSVLRFIIFDGGGLVALLIAVGLTWKLTQGRAS